MSYLYNMRLNGHGDATADRHSTKLVNHNGGLIYFNVN